MPRFKKLHGRAQALGGAEMRPRRRRAEHWTNGDQDDVDHASDDDSANDGKSISQSVWHGFFSRGNMARLECAAYQRVFPLAVETSPTGNCS